MQPSTTHPTSLSDYFLLAILIGILLAIGHLLLPLAGALLGAVVIAIAFHPLHQRIIRWMPRRSRMVHALVTDILVVLLLVVPSVLLVWVITKEAENLAPTTREWRATVQELREGNTDAITPLRRVRSWLYKTVGLQPAQFRQQFGSIVDRFFRAISYLGGALAKHSFAFLLNLVVMLITLFFIFKDGDKMADTFGKYVPLAPELKHEMSDKFQQTVRSVLRGWFVTALIQGLVASIGYLIAGVPAVALLGVLTALFGLIPSIGTALVWLPLGIFYLSQQSMGKGIFILGWGLLVVSVIDNLLRPYLVKNQAHMSFLALFLAIIGGVEAFGTKGILIGPILFALMWPLLEAYRRRYLERHGKAA